MGNSSSSSVPTRRLLWVVYQGAIAVIGALGLWQWQNGSGAFAALQGVEVLLLLGLMGPVRRSVPEKRLAELLCAVSLLMALLAVFTALWILRQAPAPTTIHLERPAQRP